ncbi:MAG: pentapeptide repeat-containing protein [Rhodovulum sp.]|jgi:hypothetical protein|nr:pentapeptide repeat-containing protein [Rhodovulum sp.]
MGDQNSRFIGWYLNGPASDASKFAKIANWVLRSVLTLAIGFLALLYLALAIVLIVGLIGMILKVPHAAYDAVFAQEPKEARWLLTSTAALTAVSSAVVALPFTILRTLYNRRQTEVAEQSHITDQINKAVENLGATTTEGKTNVPLFLGGLVAFESISEQSPKFGAQAQMIVTRYLKTTFPVGNAPAPWDFLQSMSTQNEHERELAKERFLEERCQLGNQYEFSFYREQTAAQHLQSALESIIRIRDLSGTEQSVDLTRMDLTGVHFVELDLHTVRFDYSALNGAHFKNCFISGSTFRHASMIACSFENVALDRTNDFAHAQTDLCIFRGGNFPLNLGSERAKSSFADGSVPASGKIRQSHWPEKVLRSDVFDREVQKWLANRKTYKPPEISS